MRSDLEVNSKNEIGFPYDFVIPFPNIHSRVMLLSVAAAQQGVCYEYAVR